MSLPRLLALRETGVEATAGLVRAMGRLELPAGGGLVWVLGTMHKAAFLRSVLWNRPDHLKLTRTEHLDLARRLADGGSRGATVVLNGVVLSLAWIRDDVVSGLILNRPPGLTVVVCTDVPLHATDDVLEAIDATVVLPTRARHFARLVYCRYLSRSVEQADYRRAWAALLKRGSGGPRCLALERDGCLRRVVFEG